MAAAARVHRAAFDAAMPWLAGLHTPEEDARFYRERVFAQRDVWGAFDGPELVGIIAFRADWIDQLYVVPSAQGEGVGSSLLVVAQDTHPRLHLWVFKRNQRARFFYEAKGFVLVEETDGAANEEREPDALYRWTR